MDKSHNVSQVIRKQDYMVLGQVGHEMSRVMRKPTMWFLNMSDTKRAAQAQKMARCWTSRGIVIYV